MLATCYGRGMSSTPERQSSFDDVVEDASPSFPLVVADAFTGRNPKVTVARAFRVDGGGNVTIKTAAGQSRTLTGLEDPYFSEVKITEITSASAASKVRLYA